MCANFRINFICSDKVMQACRNLKLNQNKSKNMKTPIFNIVINVISIDKHTQACRMLKYKKSVYLNCRTDFRCKPSCQRSLMANQQSPSLHHRLKRKNKYKNVINYSSCHFLPVLLKKYMNCMILAVLKCSCIFPLAFSLK